MVRGMPRRRCTARTRTCYLLRSAMPEGSLPEPARRTGKTFTLSRPPTWCKYARLKPPAGACPSPNDNRSPSR